MEETVRTSNLDWIILRGGLFYGPGTGFDDDWYARAAAGTLKLPGDGSDFVSLVHIADVAAATVRAVEAWPSRETLIVCDDRPARWKDVFGFIAAAAGAAEPEPGGAARFPSFRMSNAKARKLLGWQPFHADFRMGLAR
jgi:nucleoside-diphosphate-sugar epimerase